VPSAIVHLSGDYPGSRVFGSDRESAREERSVLAQLAIVVAATTPPPSSVPDDQVTPGVWGFVITAAVAVAAVLLIVDMARRIRRLRYREEVLAKIELEKAELAESDGTAQGGSAPAPERTGSSPSA
jgi:hypothetical protein